MRFVIGVQFPKNDSVSVLNQRSITINIGALVSAVSCNTVCNIAEVSEVSDEKTIAHSYQHTYIYSWSDCHYNHPLFSKPNAHI